MWAGKTGGVRGWGPAAPTVALRAEPTDPMTPCGLSRHAPVDVRVRILGASASKRSLGVGPRLAHAPITCHVRCKASTGAKRANVQ